MEEYGYLQTPCWCMLCFGSYDLSQAWTKHFIAVFLSNNKLEIGELQYDHDEWNQPVSSLDAPKRELGSVRMTMSRLTQPYIYLVHSSCYRLMQDHIEGEIKPARLFKLGQALQSDREMFGVVERFDIKECFDPQVPITSLVDIGMMSSHIDLLQDQSSELVHSFMKLPYELQQMIIQWLPPSSLIKFLCRSESTLGLMEGICSGVPQFYRFNWTTNPSSTKWGHVIKTIFKKFTPENFASLDKRWELIVTVLRRAKIMRFLSDHFPSAPTISVRDFSKKVDHSFGFQELFLCIPKDIKVLKVYRKLIDLEYYVCGLEASSEMSSAQVGRASSSFYLIPFQESSLQHLRFVMDSRGIIAIKLGDSSWPTGEFEHSKCWEGLSKRTTSDFSVRVIRDSVKFRQIGWHHRDRDAITFEEKVLMKSSPLSRHGSISEDLFVDAESSRNSHLIQERGFFPVHSLWLSDSRTTQAILIDGDEPMDDLHEMLLQGTSPNRSKTKEMRRLFPLHSPKEHISEAIFEVPNNSSSDHLAVTLKTNLRRQCKLGCVYYDNYTNYTRKTLRPPQGNSIVGFYFRYRCYSFGIIYAPSKPCDEVKFDAQLILNCPTPDLPPGLGGEHGLRPFHVFPSHARLFGARQIRVYYNAAPQQDHTYCVGLLIIYKNNMTEAVGRAYGQAFQTHHIPASVTSYYAIVKFRDHGYKVASINFSTTPSNYSKKDSDTHQITPQTVVSWWFRNDWDVIRFSESYNAQND